MFYKRWYRVDDRKILAPSSQAPIRRGVRIQYLVRGKYSEDRQRDAPGYPENEWPVDVRLDRIQKVGSREVANTTGFQDSEYLRD